MTALIGAITCTVLAARMAFRDFKRSKSLDFIDLDPFDKLMTLVIKRIS